MVLPLLAKNGSTRKYLLGLTAEMQDYMTVFLVLYGGHYNAQLGMQKIASDYKAELPRLWVLNNAKRVY